MLIQLENRLIAFLDVLGFSHRLQNEDIASLHSKYSEFIDKAKEATFFKTQGDNIGRTNFEFSQFLFDSIVLVSNPIHDVYNVNNFLSAVSLLLELGFKNQLPLRGAISKGDFLFDPERTIFLSKEFPELAKFELKQEWSGCSILPSAESTVSNAVMGVCNYKDFPREQKRNQLIHRYEVPLKNNEIRSLYVLNFLFFLSELEINEGIEFLIHGKKENFTKYFEFLKLLPLQIQILDESFAPAVSCACLATRSGVRVKFIDEDGKPCVPASDFDLVVQGRWYEQT